MSNNINIPPPIVKWNAPSDYSSNKPPTPQSARPTTADLVLMKSVGGALPAADQRLVDQAFHGRYAALATRGIALIPGVLDECLATSRKGEVDASVAQAKHQEQYRASSNRAIDKKDKKADREFASAVAQAAGKMADGAMQTGGAAKAMSNKVEANKLDKSAKAHEKRAADGDAEAQQKAEEVDQYDAEINKVQREGFVGEERHDQAVREHLKDLSAGKELAKVDARSLKQEANAAAKAATQARKQEAALRDDDTILAAARGMGACIGGSADTFAAGQSRAAAKEGNDAERLELNGGADKDLAGTHESLSDRYNRRAESLQRLYEQIGKGSPA